MNLSSATNAEHARAEVLLQRYFDRTLDLEQARELAEFWDANPQFELVARKNFKIEQALKFYARLTKSPIQCDEQDVPELERNLILETTDSPFAGQTGSVIPEPPPLDFDVLLRLVAESQTIPLPAKETVKKHVKRSKNVLPYQPESKKIFARNVGLLLIVLMAFGIGMFLEFRPKTPIPTSTSVAKAPLARITAVADPIFPEDAPIFKRNQQLDDTAIRLEAGLIELRLRSGVRVVLEGPAVFNVQNDVSTFCQRGRASVEVPPGAEGFEVQTPLMNVRDLGTAFVVDATEDECAVHVVKGQVEIQRLNESRALVREGIGMIAQSGRETVQTPADKKHYIPAARMTSAASLYEKRCLGEWDQGRLRRTNDPSVLIDLDFDQLEQSDGVTQIIGTKKVAGRWTDKSGRAFTGASDTIRLSVPRKLKSFTLIASVCLNDLSQASCPILSVGDMERGALHWQINDRGELQLLLGMKDQERLVDFASGSILSPLQFGVWMSAATVVDADKRTITHYLDGRPVATLPWQDPIEIDFSESDLGHWPRRDRSPTVRRFNGAIDEFILSDRALSPDEISAIFH